MAPPLDDQREAILEASIDALERGDRSAVERACRDWPELADQVRAAAGVMAELQAARATPSSATATTLRPPDSVGRFRVVGLLGQGGMGIVFRAYDPQLDREVALKVQPAGLSASPRSADRFRREARVLAQIRHPHIVAIHDVGATEEGVPYFAMDLVEGRTLAAVLEDAGTKGIDALRSEHLLPGPAGNQARPGSYLDAAVRFVAKVADALQHAHQAGITHRDVKPSNLLVDPAGEPHLVDFGIARDGDNPAATSPETFAGAGTPAYMAPEQINEDGAVGPWTDVYALGVVLYELITLQRPFVGATSQQVLRRILEVEPASPRRLHRRVSRDLETICLTALQKDPRRRYASARAFADDLASLQARRPIRARPPGRGARLVRFVRRNPWPMALAGVALVAATAGVLGQGLRARLDRAQAQAHVDLAQQLMIGEVVGPGSPFEAAIAHLQLANELVPTEGLGRELMEDIARARTARQVDDLAAAELQRCRDLRQTGGDSRAIDERTRSVLRSLNELALLAADSEILDRRFPEVFAERGLLARSNVPDLDAAEQAFDASARAEGKGTLALLGAPAGARVHLFRYEERDDRGRVRLVPLPYPGRASAASPPPGQRAFVVERVTPGAAAALAGIEVGDLLVEGEGLSLREEAFDQPLPRGGLELRVLTDGGLRNVTLRGAGKPGLATIATAYPLACGPDNAVGTLPYCRIAVEPGSYLLLVRSAQHEDLRLPAYLEAPTRVSLRADLHPEETSPRGFVHVAAGEFIAGGGGTSRPAQRRWLDGYWIGRDEVSSQDYLAFLRDPRTRSDIERARKNGRWVRIPRARGWGDSELRVIDRLLWRLREDGSYETDRDLRLPISGISCQDGEAYCRWLTARADERNEPWLFRLPTEDEWEKAARGVDGREFPWGSRFDPSLCWITSPLRANGSTGSAPIVSRPLDDESPFGVRDAAGGVLEWCAGKYLGTPMRPWRSGAWGNTDPAFSRCAASNGGLAWRVDEKDGLRIVAVRRDR